MTKRSNWSAVRAMIPNIRLVITLAGPRTRIIRAPKSSFRRAKTLSLVLRSLKRCASCGAKARFFWPRRPWASITGTWPKARRCATQLLAANEHPKVVSERLGHASITLTLDTYSHVLPSMQQAACDKLDRLLYR